MPLLLFPTDGAKQMPYGGVYEKMKFPEVPYAEYPKLVHKKDGTKMIVNNQAEELRAIDEIVPIADAKKLEQEKANLEKLLAEAQEKLKAMEEAQKGKEPSQAPPPSVTKPGAK